MWNLKKKTTQTHEENRAVVARLGAGPRELGEGVTRSELPLVEATVT